MSGIEKNAALLSLIRGAETSRGHDDYSSFAVISPPKPVTQMTINEVAQWQRKAARAGSESVAIGGYQMIGKTFRSVVKEMGLTGNEVFNADTQDRMGMHLLNRRGYNEWIAGGMSDEAFGDNLAKEWAGLPRVTGSNAGQSHYAGDGLNASTVSTGQVLEALAAGKAGTPWEFKKGAGGAPVVAGEQSRNDILNSMDPDQNYTGNDMAQEGYSTMPEYRSVLDNKEAEAAVEKPAFFEGARMAVDEEWIGTNVARQMGREKSPIDYDFQYTPELWDEVTDGLSEVYQDALSDAVSEDHARVLATELKRNQDVDSKLASLGMGGMGLRFSAALLDPVAIAVSAGTGTAAAPFIYGAKVGKLGRTVRAGLLAGTTNAAIDGYLISQDPARQWNEIAYSAAAGFVLGGALGSRSRIPEDTELEGAMQNVMKNIETEEAAKLAPADGSMGAARVPQEPTYSVSEQTRMDSQNAPTTAKPMGAPRLDRVGQLKQSPNGITRRVAALFGEDGVGNADGSVNVRSASENVARETRVRFSRFYRDYNEAYKGWRKDRGLRWWQHGAETRREFNTAVGQAVRREIDAQGDAHVNKVASRMKTEFRDLLEFGRDQGIRGFDEIKENYNYMVRKHRIGRLDDLVNKHGEGNVHRLVAGSLMSNNRKRINRTGGLSSATEELDYEDALGMAQAYVKSIRSRRYGDFNVNRALGGQDMDTLKMMLDDSGLSPEQVTKITDKVRLGADNGEAGRMGVAQRRLDLDETHTIDLIDGNGVKSTVGIEDFLENDAELLFTNYARSVLGTGYMEEALSSFKKPDAEGFMPLHSPSFETVKGYIRDEAGSNGMTPNALKTEMRKLDNLYKAVMGQPIEDATTFNEAQRLLRDYNFSRIGGQLGVAQLAEVGNIIGNGGMRVMLQNVPALKKVFWSAKKGKFSDDLYNDIEAIWGFGTDLTRSSPNVKFDDNLGSFEGASGKWEKADHVLQRAKIATSVGSGMAHINMGLQRLNARVLVQRFMDDANGTRPINTKRLRVMGIADDLQPRIQEQLRKHVDESKGMLGRKVKRINIEKWDDLDAKNAFVNGVDRWAKKSIQENDVGNMPDFMSYEMGKTIGQFRSFMMAAYTKQLLSGVHHKDWETFSSFSLSMMFGGMFYAAQQSVNAVGRDDREEWLEERLAPANIAKASFQRAGFSSVLPIAADFGAGFVGMEPIFDFRSSGLSTSNGLAGTLLSNPTGDLIDGVARGAQGISSAVVSGDYDFSQQDFRHASKVVLFQNAFGIRNVLAAVGGTLPKYSQ